MDDILRFLLNSLDLEPKVEEVMTREVVSCGADDELSSVWELMEHEELSGLPVVQREKGKVRVVGVVTRTDIISSGTARIAGESKKGKTPPKVKSIMRTPVITIPPEVSLSKAVDLMLSKKVKRLPVVRAGELIGIISRSDILKMVCR